MELALVNTKNQKADSLKVNKDIFGAQIKEHLLHQVVVMQLAKRRRGTASTKLRHEVRGGGKKPWKQKGTGRARAGSSRSPLWRGGGIVFGPKPRDYSFKVTRKMSKIALISALSLKAKSNDIVILDKLELESPKTKEIALFLLDLKISETVLFLIEQENRNLQLAVRNLPKANILKLSGLNVYDLLSSSKLIMTEEVIHKIEERLQ